jgi:hypothetical protein
MSNRIERLKEYANPTRAGNWNGASRDQADLDRWSKRATEQSQCAPRASDKAMRLPDTNAKQQLDPKSSPRTSAEIDARMSGRDDPNHVGGGGYMKTIRRNG